jgi:hypothetical protein
MQHVYGHIHITGRRGNSSFFSQCPYIWCTGYLISGAIPGGMLLYTLVQLCGHLSQDYLIGPILPVKGGKPSQLAAVS